MPTFAEHQNNAIKLFSLLEKYEECGLIKDHADWYVTKSFYLAVDIIEAIIFKSGPKNIIRPNYPSEIENCKHSYQTLSFYETDSEHLARQLLMRDNPDIFPISVSDAYLTIFEISQISKAKVFRTAPNDWKECKSNINILIEHFSNVLKILPQKS